ncbi:MAG: hypothetical protein DMG59_06240 [Acidobacteria bacterium]|nr:MAG: hypothetical protein DMG59_06240 [Acidobacteriota bacterium]
MVWIHFGFPAMNVLLQALLLLCIARLWLMPLPSSFWVDEMVTAFVVRFGPTHPSLAVAPQVPASIYYVLPRAAGALFGFSEIAYRLPSVLAMAIALFLIARLAARLICPEAAWFAVFACLALRGINYQAADARPYALGTCVAAASLLFLVRWLDSGGWDEALLFAVFAALVWRVHLIFWPLYLLFAVYALLRLVRGDTRAGWLRAGVVFLLVGLALAPVLRDALPLFREAKAHVIVPPPSALDLVYSLKIGLIAVCGAGAWVLSRVFRSATDRPAASWASLTLILGWWLCHPLCLFGFSWLTGDSVFLPRYLSVALPGAALMATMAAAFFIQSRHWKPASVVLGAGLLLLLGDWHHPWPPHSNSDWRAAARKVNELALGPETPVIYPSPFIEARPPAWRPDYPLPGFLYAHLLVYPVQGKAYLFPFQDSPEADHFAASLSTQVLSASRRFVIFGGDQNVHFWRDWLAVRHELEGWRHIDLGPFGDVDAVLFERPRNAVRLELPATLAPAPGTPAPHGSDRGARDRPGGSGGRRSSPLPSLREGCFG